MARVSGTLPHLGPVDIVGQDFHSVGLTSYCVIAWERDYNKLFEIHFPRDANPRIVLS